MTTLIEVYDKSGNVHRCDARCYNASPDEKCNCICGGANHGVGYVTAHNQAYENGETWIARAVAHNGELFAYTSILAQGKQEGIPGL